MAKKRNKSNIKYHPFEEAFERFEKSKNLKGVKTFHELKEMFQNWGGKNAPLTRKQEKALAIEGENKLDIDIHVREEKYFDRKSNQIKTRYRDVITGSFTKQNSVSNIPVWRKTETMNVGGARVNTKTGEKLIVRNENGQYLKKSEWKLFDKDGKEIKIE